jgi:hypothetical protein
MNAQIMHRDRLLRSRSLSQVGHRDNAVLAEAERIRDAAAGLRARAKGRRRATTRGPMSAG